MRLRQRRFVDEYLIDLDAAQAALRAGYARRHISPFAWQLVRRPEIAAAIAEAMAARAERTGIMAERVLREYARLAFADVRDVADWGPDGASLREAAALSDAAAASIAELVAQESDEGVEMRWRLFDKASALGSLARLLGLFDPPAAGVAASAGSLSAAP